MICGYLVACTYLNEEHLQERSGLFGPILFTAQPDFRPWPDLTWPDLTWPDLTFIHTYMRRDIYSKLHIRHLTLYEYESASDGECEVSNMVPHLRIHHADYDN